MTATTLSINGRSVTADIEPRVSLADFIRDHEGLTGTHTACTCPTSTCPTSTATHQAGACGLDPCRG